MGTELRGRKIAVLATDMFEQIELTRPVEAVEAAGGEVELVSLEAGEIQGFDHYDKADRFPVDKTVDAADAGRYDALLLPGGVGNPDTMRANEQAVRFVRDFFGQGKPVAAICHAAWMLVEADVVRGRRLTSYPSIRTDVRNAGGDWVDEEVVVDQGLVTSRSPKDLDAFCAKLVEEFAEGRHEGQRREVGAAARGA